MLQPQLEQTLTQLASTFTVRDIMVPDTALVRAESVDHATRLLEEHPDYDCIPLPVTGTIGAYVSRQDRKLHPLRQVDLISDGTSILALLDLLRQRPFYLVLASNEVKGFVHFSDLNNSLVKLPLFVLFEAIERHLSPLVAAHTPSHDGLTSLLGQERFDELSQRVGSASAHQANRSLVDYLSFGELLLLAEHYGLIAMRSADRGAVVDVRNRVAHSNRPLIKQHRDVRTLVKARDTMLCLLREGTRR